VQDGLLKLDEGLFVRFHSSKRESWANPHKQCLLVYPSILFKNKKMSSQSSDFSGRSPR